jgi:hypothetical protein
MVGGKVGEKAGASEVGVAGTVDPLWKQGVCQKIPVCSFSTLPSLVGIWENPNTTPCYYKLLNSRSMPRCVPRRVIAADRRRHCEDLKHCMRPMAGHLFNDFPTQGIMFKKK